MKKLMALLGLVVLVFMGCGTSSIEKTLTEGDGEWRLKFNDQESVKVKFYDDDNVEFYSGGQAAATGTYKISEKEKRVSITWSKGKTILNNMTLKNEGDFTATYADESVELIKEK